VLPQPPDTHNRVNKGTGTTQDDNRMVRAVAYPLIHSYDIWMNSDSNERWMIRAVKPVAQIRRLPIILNLELRLIPQTDVIYSTAGENKATEVPTPAPTGTEHTWSDDMECLDV